MKVIKKKLLSRRGQASFELIIMVSSASLIAIIVSYFFILSTKNLGYDVDKTGEKAEKFINITNNKSSQYVELLNNST